MVDNITKTGEHTKSLGKELAKSLVGGEIIALIGELGSGKTTFVKGIGQGLGITRNITSPTFTLMNVYSVPENPQKITKFAHVDTYRLENESDLVNIGITDYLQDKHTIVAIEWPEKISKILFDKKVQTIKFEHSENGRKITI